MFPPQNDPATNVNHQVTVAATTSWTRVTAEVLESNFIQHIFLSAYQSETIDLPLLVRMSSDYSSYILSVNSTWPVTVLVSFCSHAVCDYTLLHDVSSWGTHYYLIAPHFSKQAAVSQMVITSLEDEPSVKIQYFSLGRCSSEAMCTLKGASLSCIWERCSVCLQSDSSLSGSELNSQKAVVVGFTCSKHTPGVCLYGFAQRKPVESWRFDYFIPPLANTGTSSSFLLAMTAVSSEVHITTDNERERESLSLVGRIALFIF